MFYKTLKCQFNSKTALFYASNKMAALVDEKTRLRNFPSNRNRNCIEINKTVF